MESYNSLVELLKENPNIYTPLTPEKWAPYATKAENLSMENAEFLYAHIINYNNLTTAKVESLPYESVKLSGVGGVKVSIHSLPAPLQHILCAILDRL